MAIKLERQPKGNWTRVMKVPRNKKDLQAWVLSTDQRRQLELSKQLKWSNQSISELNSILFNSQVKVK